MPARKRIRLLPEKEFWAAYRRCCPPIRNRKDPKIRKSVYDELNRLDSVLRPAIDARWKGTDAYYAFNDDWEVAWHHSMGVYSDQMCCSEFLDIVQRALAQMEHDWCFHVSLECREDMGWGLQHGGWGQIFFYRGKIYGNRKDNFKYELFENRPGCCGGGANRVLVSCRRLAVRRFHRPLRILKSFHHAGLR